MRRWTLAFAFAAASASLVRETATSSANTNTLPRSTAVSKYVGAGSCSASACHNSNAAHGAAGSEYTTWITRDPHARAYEVLFNERSKSMQARLRQSVPAHEDRRCLKCHVAPDFEAANPPPAASYFKTDGVSCESCHGGAKDWLNQHHLDGWRGMSALEKKRHGMNDTRSLVGRAQLCASCHVGGAGMDVDHELLAAGHPRLHFEFSAFHAHLPRHWSDAKDRANADFETRAWLAGQLATAHAALDLLAARASKASAWPEFAEFDCAACHHNLQEPSVRQKAGFASRRPGVLPWGHQIALASIALERIPNTKGLREQLQSLQKRMDAINPASANVAKEAREAAISMKATLDRAHPELNGLLDREALGQLLSAQEKKTASASDVMTQIHLGFAALDGHKTNEWTPKLHGFDPDAIRARLTQFKKTTKER